jgi:anti-sigma-K factor RskA
MDRIDQYIEEQKQTGHSPYLAARILTKIENLKAEKNKGTSAWRHLAMTASLAFVIALGIAIGSSYRLSKSHYTALLVNDTYMELLSMYENDADE